MTGDSAVALVRGLSPERLASYRQHCGGDLDAGLALYDWNAKAAGAMWVVIGHMEVVLRNALAERLAARHTRLARPGSWLDDSAGELNQSARDDISKARRYVVDKGKPASDGQTLTELTLGFWRFLLARRYTSTLWPDLAGAFPHAPNRRRQTVEDLVIGLHKFRNRLAHHERVWTEPIAERHADVVTLLDYIDPEVSRWVSARSWVPTVLASCPTTLPNP